LALAVPLSRFTSQVGRGSAFFVRQQAHAMNLFEMSYLLSPLGGAFGSAMAVHQHSSSSSVGFAVGIPLGLVGGFGIYRGLMRLAVLRAETAQRLSSWRAAAVLGVGFFAPCASAAICFWLSRLFYYVAA
jgi:hypothetical protein